MLRRFCAVRAILGSWIALFSISSDAAADVSTLTLDGFSFISFQDEVTNSISGGMLRFHFGIPNPDGTIPFTLSPADVALSPVTIASLNARLQYGLASDATGIMIPTPTGRMIYFGGTVSAQDLDSTESTPRTYALSFSTEVAFSEGLDGTEVEREGVRVPPGTRYVQLVGATVNESENLHGAAVYMVLSGTFDHLP